MAGYLQKTYEAGPMKIVTKYFSSRYGSRGGSREDWSRPTPEKVAELNERRSEFKLCFCCRTSARGTCTWCSPTAGKTARRRSAS